MSLHRRILLTSGSNGPDLSSPPSPSPSHQIPSHLIIAAASAAAASLFLFIIYYAVLRRRRRGPAASIASGHATLSSSSSSGVDHPIWHIKTLGLDESAIESIGSYAHIGGDLTAASDDCLVCLGEIADGETVRLLPRCGHVFHVRCIDTWLGGHVSCPLCRAAVLDPVSDDADAEVDGGLVENPLYEEEGEGEARVRVSVEAPESSGTLRSASMDAAVFKLDEEKDGNCSNSEKEQSESGRVFLFSRLGRARSSSVLPL